MAYSLRQLFGGVTLLAVMLGLSSLVVGRELSIGITILLALVALGVFHHPVRSR